MPGTIELKCTFASMPWTERGRATVLGGDPKGQNFLYCNRKNVYIRDINDPAKFDVYADHEAKTKVAKYSPSGIYIASGDETGKVRIWDTTNPEHILKNEFNVLGKEVRDIAWDSESQKLAIVGDGSEVFAKCIALEHGNTVGELGGPNKGVNSVAYKPTRPFRIATGSDDMKSRFYEGPPFKYKQTNWESTHFIHCVRYNPTGDVYITASADGKVLIYDGQTSKYLGALGGEKAHKGGIYALDFSNDGSKVLTVSEDKTAKIWNLASRELEVEFLLGKEIPDMQVGCLWQGDNIITVSVSGYINFLDRNNPSSPRKILKGHNKPISCMAVTPDRSTIYTGDSSGQIFYWGVKTGECEIISGKGHAKKITAMTIAGDWLITVSMDDIVRYTSISRNEYDSSSEKLPSHPQAVSATPDGIAVITCSKHIVVVNKGSRAIPKAVEFGQACVDIHPSQKWVAIGGCKEIRVFKFDVKGNTLSDMETIKCDLTDDWTNVCFSPDGQYLAATGGSKRHTVLYSCEDGDHIKFQEIFKATKQTGKLFCLEWSPSSEHFATGSQDGSVAVWGLKPGNDNVTHYEKFAHKNETVVSIAWLSDKVFVTSGTDCCIRQWTLVD